MTTNLKFKCPECSSAFLEEVMTGVTQSTSFTELFIDTADPNCNDIVEPLYLDSSNEGGEVVRYQCMHCGYLVPCCTNPHSLRVWLEMLKINQPS